LRVVNLDDAGWNGEKLGKLRGAVTPCSGDWQLRHPVGPDAAPTIAWRKGMTDEQWVDLHSADDETFQRLMGGS
jgi:hypothetical protein